MLSLWVAVCSLSYLDLAEAYCYFLAFLTIDEACSFYFRPSSNSYSFSVAVFLRTMTGLCCDFFLEPSGVFTPFKFPWSLISFFYVCVSFAPPTIFVLIFNFFEDLPTEFCRPWLLLLRTAVGLDAMSLERWAGVYCYPLLDVADVSLLCFYCIYFGGGLAAKLLSVLLNEPEVMCIPDDGCSVDCICTELEIIYYGIGFCKVCCCWT